MPKLNARWSTITRTITALNVDGTYPLAHLRRAKARLQACEDEATGWRILMRHIRREWYRRSTAVLLRSFRSISYFLNDYFIRNLSFTFGLHRLHCLSWSSEIRGIRIHDLSQKGNNHFSFRGAGAPRLRGSWVGGQRSFRAGGFQFVCW